VAALVLAFALLAPLLNAFLGQQPGRPPCHTSCCRGAKTCSCRQRSSPGSLPHGTGWTSAPSCSKDCGPAVGLPGSPGMSLTPARNSVGPALSECPIPINLPAEERRRGANSVLFQRPPPFLS